MNDIENLDMNNNVQEFNSGQRVLVRPLGIEATVIEQLKFYDGGEWFWGNVRLRYDDGVEGTSNSWQLEKL